MTPTEAQSLVDLHGSVRRAALMAGIPYATFWARLHPERAAEHSRRSSRRHQQNLSGLAYNHLLLRNRRTKALRRMAAREQRRQANG